MLWRVVLEKQQIVSFDGRITVDNSNEMRERLGAALKLKPRELMVDLSQVTSIDKSGVATLVEATGRARRQDTRLMITGLQGQPAYLLKVTQMDQLFDIAVEQQKP
jgi:anti-sigma B factor antagonist